MIVPLYVVVIVVGTVAVGLVAIYLVRLSRRQQNALSHEGFDHWLSPRQPATLVQAVRVMIFGPQPKAMDVVFRVVTIATALVLFSAVGALFVLAGMHIW